jgi:putative membrane protein insertion efficiency factor
MNHEKKYMFFIRKDDSGISDDHDQPEEENTEDTSTDKVARKAMVSTIGFYKSYISPLLPPACRFTPTCSQYGIQAIEEYGAQKGVILIAWRLLRCSPIGGRGFDPPQWPPPGWNSN